MNYVYYTDSKNAHPWTHSLNMYKYRTETFGKSFLPESNSLISLRENIFQMCQACAYPVSIILDNNGHISDLYSKYDLKSWYYKLFLQVELLVKTLLMCDKILIKSEM